MSSPYLPPPPQGPQWNQWGERLNSWLIRTKDRLRQLTTGETAADDGILMWDRENEYPVVSKNGEWVPLSFGGTDVYGSFVDFNAQSASTINTPTAITWGTTAYSKGISVGSPTSRIVFSETGQYLVTFSAELHSESASAKTIYIYPRINGTDVTGSTMVNVLNDNDQRKTVSRTALLSITAGDYLEAIFSVDDTDLDMHGLAATAFAPATPSVTLSAMKVGNVSGGGGLADVVSDTTPQLGGNLDVNGHDITSSGGGNVEIYPSTNGDVIITASGTGVVSIEGNEFPDSYGSSGQVLTTDGAGVLSWADASGGGGGVTAWMMLQSDYALTSSTTTQKLFNVGSSGNGSFDLATGVYRFSGVFYMSGLSSVAIQDKFTFTGSATIGKIFTAILGTDRSNLETPSYATDYGTYFLTNAEMQITAGSSGTNVAARIQGIIDITGTGTLIPSIKLGYAPTGTAYVKSPSWFTVERIADTGSSYGGDVI